MPEVEMMMGTGNLTELTEADSLGVTAMLLGVCSELSIRNVLVVQVSPHTRRTIEEHDAARRLMYAAKADRALPKGYGNALLALHDKRPFTETIAEIESAAAQVRDANFRIIVASDGIHVYNRDSHVVGTEALALFSKLAIGSDTGHAFYLGGELAKAEIAWRLGKRYSQDEPLDFGCAADAAAGPTTGFKPAGPTFGPSGRTER
jgi:dihydropteroate synthase